ncbi:MAG: hypothetical protein LBS92_05400 [Candidatus Methanoplasma sp.]|jgi:AAA+ ATPase superfamily predicted ATPase|nr:hypothetical protein [Candidatus Methanoplasma sp.]
MHGRRRVGKTAIIKEFCTGKRTVLRRGQHGTLLALKGRSKYVSGFDARRYVVFSRGGFDDRIVAKAESEGISLVSLDDVFAE